MHGFFFRFLIVYVHNYLYFSPVNDEKIKNASMLKWLCIMYPEPIAYIFYYFILYILIHRCNICTLEHFFKKFEIFLIIDKIEYSL